MRRWHPGQAWIWQAGGLGVFDPGINALSIMTAILPEPIHVTEATLDVPENRQTPIAADLTFYHPQGAEVTAALDWDHTGDDIWRIEAVTDAGTLTLDRGGAELRIDGAVQSAGDGLHGEYPRLYANMAQLVETGQSDVALGPARHVWDAMPLGRHRIVAPVHW